MKRALYLLCAGALAAGCFDSPLSSNDDRPGAKHPPINTTPFDRDLPAEAALTTVLQVGDTVYFFGGRNATDDAVDSVWAFDLGERKWITRSAMPTPRYYAGAVAAGGFIYVIGGRDRTAETNELSRLVERYDPAADSWTTLGIAEPRGIDGTYPTYVASARGRLYAISTLRTSRTTVLYESSDGVTWEAFPLDVPAEHEPTLMSDGDDLYLLMQTGEYFGRGFYRIDPATKRVKPDAPPYRYDRGYTNRWITYDGAIYNVNGIESGDDVIARFDGGSRSWTFNSVPYDITTNRHFVPIVTDHGMGTLYLFAPPHLRIGTHYSTVENRFYQR